MLPRNPKSRMPQPGKVLILLASGAAALLLAALFAPLFCGVLFFAPVSWSLWEQSHLITLLPGIGIPAIVALPIVSRRAATWVAPLALGIILLLLTAAAISHSVASEFSGVLFHPCGLTLLASGGLLCLAEGLLARSHPLA